MSEATRRPLLVPLGKPTPRPYQGQLVGWQQRGSLEVGTGVCSQSGQQSCLFYPGYTGRTPHTGNSLPGICGAKVQDLAQGTGSRWGLLSQVPPVILFDLPLLVGPC